MTTITGVIEGITEFTSYTSRTSSRTFTKIERKKYMVSIRYLIKIESRISGPGTGHSRRHSLFEIEVCSVVFK